MIKFSDVIENVEVERYGRRAKSLQNIERFRNFEEGYGTTAKVAVLFVDLRKSTDRAVEIGPKNTYLTTHTLLATLARLVTDGGGRVANFRGDGLFGLFGLNERGENGPDFSFGEEVKKATPCGKAMLEAVYDAINPTLAENGVPDGLNIGVGIDIGDVVITRVGLPGISEVTAYGNAVNHAAKYCGGNGVIIISDRAWKAWPPQNGGRLRVKRINLSDNRIGLKVIYPPEYNVLKRLTAARR